MNDPINDLTDLRVLIRDALVAAGVHAFTTAPDRVSPPCAFVTPGDPYWTREGATIGGAAVVRLQVSVVAAKGTTDVQATALDELVLKALAVVEEVPDVLEVEVDRPGTISINKVGPYLAAAIAVAIEIR